MTQKNSIYKRTILEYALEYPLSGRSQRLTQQVTQYDFLFFLTALDEYGSLPDDSEQKTRMTKHILKQGLNWIAGALETIFAVNAVCPLVTESPAASLMSIACCFAVNEVERFLQKQISVKMSRTGKCAEAVQEVTECQTHSLTRLLHKGAGKVIDHIGRDKSELSRAEHITNNIYHFSVAQAFFARDVVQCLTESTEENTVRRRHR